MISEKKKEKTQGMQGTSAKNTLNHLKRLKSTFVIFEVDLKFFIAVLMQFLDNL